MDYTGLVKRSWNMMWRSGGIWGFVLSTWAVIFVLAAAFGAVIAFSAYSVAITSSVSTTTIAVLIGGVVLLILLAIPLGIISNAGLAHLTNEGMAERPVRFGDGWRAGFQRFGSVLAVDALVWLIGLVVGGIFTVVFLLIGGAALLPLITSGQTSRAPEALAGIALSLCCFGVVAVVVLIPLSWVIGGFESLSVRYAVIGGQGGGSAISLGWGLVKSRLRNVIGVSAVMFGISIAVNIPLSLIRTVLDQLGKAGGSTQVMMGLISLIVALLSSFVSLGLVILTAGVWTAAYRALTGMDSLSPGTQAPAPGFPPPPSQPSARPPMPPGAPPVPSAPPPPSAPPSTPTGSRPADTQPSDPSEDPWAKAHEIPPLAGSPEPPPDV